MEERQLIEGLHEADRATFSSLYDQYAAALYGIILKIVKDEETAEDILQESFIKIWENGSAYNPDKGTLFTWMLNICRNAAIDKTRSAHFRRQSTKRNIDQKITDNLDWSYTPKTEHIGVKSVVTKLDEKYQEIIDLVYFQGFTQQEVHEHLNIPLGTVKSRLRIGLRELRAFFQINQVSILGIFIMYL